MSSVDQFSFDFTNIYFLSLLSIIVAYLLSVRMYPVIIYLARERNLMDEPMERSMHSSGTPTLGGVGLFVTFSLSIILFGMFLKLEQPDLIKLLSIVAASIILLFLGVKDDLMVLSPRKKFSGQILSAAIIIFFTDVRIHSFYGLFGVEDLPYMVSVL